jgi:hypothetical protein
MGYCRLFIPSSATIATPLTNMTKKRNPVRVAWTWEAKTLSTLTPPEPAWVIFCSKGMWWKLKYDREGRTGNYVGPGIPISWEDDSGWSWIMRSSSGWRVCETAE